MSYVLPARSTAVSPQRALSPTAVRSGRWLPMLGQQIRTEFMKLWRIPAFSASVLLFPVILFVLFAVPYARETLPNGSSAGKYLLASFCAYGLLGVAFFSFGISVATERGQGWMRLIRATPLPATIFITAKIVMALMFAVLLLALMFPLAFFAGHVRMATYEWIMLFINLVVGVLPFSMVGFALGYWAGPNSAAPIANIVYLPLSFASGLWQPLESLPAIVQRIAPYLPPYHYAQLVRRAVGVEDGKTGQHLAWLLGTALVFGLLSAWGYRRDQDKQYG
ncbi:MAG: ABC transporter permease [Herpetosiphonaceae bacterium]|nr:ABC transporter permease [Herpetosiphonaceae bacterium]